MAAHWIYDLWPLSKLTVRWFRRVVGGEAIIMIEQFLGDSIEMAMLREYLDD